MTPTTAQFSSGATPECNGESPKPGAVVPTACGGVVNYTSQTPCASWQGQTVYFCLPCCRDDFLSDPRSSCLAHKLNG
jgi:YHS domain-containing protein